MQQTIAITDAIHITGVLHAISSRIDRIGRVGEIMGDQTVLLKARTNSAGPTGSTRPTAGKGFHLTTCSNQMGRDHSIPTLLCREK